MTRPQPRPYQSAAHDAAWARFDDHGDPSTLVVMPTGTGKTVLAAMMAETARARGTRTLFLAHREVLISQASRTLRAFGLEVAVEMGQQDARAHGTLFGHAEVVVATVQTLQGDRLRSWDRRHFGLIITDESHRAAAAEHQNVYSWFQALHMGITATPDGSSGAIGNVFKSWAYHYQMRQAVEDGYLVPPIHERCKIPIDLKDLKTTGGDFAAGDLAERINPRIEYIADAIKQRIGDTYAVAFTPTVASARSLAMSLATDSPSGPGLPAAYVAGTAGEFGMPMDRRREILGSFERRELRVLVCCDLLFEGWDAPHVGAVVIARPTLVRYRYAQMVGRGTRICPDLGKDKCLIVDFDWQTNGAARDLITPVELFSEDDPELLEMSQPDRQRVVADARRILANGEVDPRKALETAKAANRRQAVLPMVLTGTRAEFEVEVYDPLSVADLAGIKLKKRTDLWTPKSGYEPIRHWQVRQLGELGVQDPEKLTFFGACKLKRSLEKRKKEGLATLPQVREMLRLGVGEVNARCCTTDQASAVIGELRLRFGDRESASTTDVPF